MVTNEAPTRFCYTAAPGIVWKHLPGYVTSSPQRFHGDGQQWWHFDFTCHATHRPALSWDHVPPARHVIDVYLTGPVRHGLPELHQMVSLRVPPSLVSAVAEPPRTGTRIRLWLSAAACHRLPAFDHGDHS